MASVKQLLTVSVDNWAIPMLVLSLMLCECQYKVYDDLLARGACTAIDYSIFKGVDRGVMLSSPLIGPISIIAEVKLYHSNF